jgi:hypothetical protein
MDLENTWRDDVKYIDRKLTCANFNIYINSSKFANALAAELKDSTQLTKRARR